MGSVGCVVFVLLSLLSMAEGIRTAILESGDPARVVLRASSTPWLHDSRLPGGVAEIASGAPGVARAADGSPMAEAVIHDVIRGFVKRSDGKARGRARGINIVGVGSHWREMTPSFRLLSGRLPRPGTNELIAGELAQRMYSSLDTGTARYRNMEWQVVGTFATGDWWDGYLVGDVAALKSYAARPTGTAVLVRLVSPQAFEAFRSAVARQLPPSVTVERETDYYAAFWRSLPKSVIYIAFLLGALIAMGAIASVTQIMHGAMEERRRETAVLRVLGFDGMAVAASVVLEGVLLAVLGALAGAALVWLWLDGVLYSGAWSVFQFTVNFHLLFVALGWAATIALSGTLPLAIRTLRQREVEALQNLRQADETAASPALNRRHAGWRIDIAAHIGMRRQTQGL